MMLSTFGCESTTPDVEDTALVTDGTSFQLDTATNRYGNLWYSTKIPYSFPNRTGSNVYLPRNCQEQFPIGMQMLEAGEWVDALLGQVMYACGVRPFTLKLPR